MRTDRVARRAFPVENRAAIARSRRPCIAVVSHGSLNLLAHRVSEAFVARADIVFVERIFDEALRELEHLTSQRAIDVLVSAGANGEFLRRSLDLPVTLVRVSGFDILNALAAAKQISERIAIFTHHEINLELEALKPLLGVPVVQSHYTGYDDADLRVEELASRGIEVFVGSSLVIELAQRRGRRGVLLYSEASTRNAIEDALSLAQLAFEEQLRRAELEAVLARLHESVLAVDAEENIRVVNNAMARLLGRPAAALIGQPLAAACPALSMHDTLTLGTEDTDRVVRLGGTLVVTTRVPIVAGDSIRGALLTCRDAAAVQLADAAVRRADRDRPQSARWTFDSIIGNSTAVIKAVSRARAFARTDSTVLICGESGTGKELFAQAIHNAGHRALRPFVAINCGAIPEALIESELFGHEEGAFTGSRRGGRRGLLESAHTGTVFLDEVSELPFAGQARLLRVLQEQQITRVGGNDPISIDVRFIAASNRPLEPMVQAGTFRADLYYRIAVLTLGLPPLRERGGDVELLAQVLLRAGARTHGIGTPDLLDEAARMIGSAGHLWRGNIRELQNLVDRLTSLWASDPKGRPQGQRGLRSMIRAEMSVDTVPSDSRDAVGAKVSLKRLARSAERARIDAALAETNGRVDAAAAALGISRSTLWRKMHSA
jgi:transcriptional regulator, propionate catabolism operon regulatory protein